MKHMVTVEAKMNFDTFKEKLGLWAEKFRPFIEQGEMYDIFEKIKNEKGTILPLSKDTFRALQTMNPNDLKVIFYLGDPYPRRYRGKIPQATGIAMDCSNSPEGILQPSLEKFYDAISNELGKPVTRNKSLMYLQEQGVMMFNTDLTVTLNKTGSHEGWWLPFQKYFLEEVMRSQTGIIYVLCGKASHVVQRFIYPISNYIFKVDHPAFAAHKHTDWDSKGIFKKINTILKENNNLEIMWDSDDWDAPF